VFVRGSAVVSEDRPQSDNASPVGEGTTIWQRDVGTDFVSRLGDRHPDLKIPSGPKLDVRIDPSLEALLSKGGEAVALQRIVDAANGLFDELLSEIDRTLTQSGGAASKASAQQSGWAEVAQGVVDRYRDRFSRLARQEWERYEQAQPEGIEAERARLGDEVVAAMDESARFEAVLEGLGDKASPEERDRATAQCNDARAKLESLLKRLDELNRSEI
jgi:hypothetical protein